MFTSSDSLVIWYIRSTVFFFNSTSASSSVTTRGFLFFVRWILSMRARSSLENPLSGCPLSKYLMSVRRTPFSVLLFLQLM